MAFALLRNCARSAIPLMERNYSTIAVIGAGPASCNGLLTEKHIDNKNAIAKPQPNLVSASVRKYSKKVSKPERAYESDSDSDSDDEREVTTTKVRRRIKPEQERKVRGNTEFWRRKMRTLHGLLDVNKDGVISYDDFQLLTQKFKSLGHLNEQAKAEFAEIMTSTWKEQWGEITPYNLITVEQYLADMHHVVNDKDLRKKVHRFLPYLYKAVDKDHSGSISIAEFKLFFRCLGLTEENAAVSFAVIDKNGDGQITLDEFIKLGRDFLLTENEQNVSKFFWGPLVEH